MMRTGRMRWFACAGLCAAAVAWLLAVALRGNIQYFRTASEAVSDRAHDGARTLRLAGAVVPGTVRSVPGGVQFEVTDGRAVVNVHHVGDPPELFKDGAPVVVEGHWLRSVFFSDRILIKHGSQYTPPSVHSTSAGASR